MISFFQEEQKKLPNSLGVELMPIASANHFMLPGPAVVGIVYVRHPIDERELIAFADYDEKLAQDRYNEALRVFTKLERPGSSPHLGVKRSTDAGPIRFQRDRRRRWTRFGRPMEPRVRSRGRRRKPIDPRPLRFRDEPMLDAVCDGVLNLGVKKGRIQITRSSTLGVDGELGLRLKHAGFKLGLSGTKATVTEFVTEAAFTPEASKSLDAVVAKTDADAIPTRRFLLRRNTP